MTVLLMSQNQKKKKVDANAEEAELLSDIGASKNKELASNRVKKMVALLERVKKEKSTDSEKRAEGGAMPEEPEKG